MITRLLILQTQIIIIKPSRHDNEAVNITNTYNNNKAFQDI